MTKPLVNKEAVRMDLYADSLQTDKIGSKLKLTAFLGDYKWVWDVEQSKLWGLSNQKRVDVCVDAFRDEFGILGVKMNFNEIASQKVIGERLRTLRKNRGLSQEQVGLDMGYANNGLISRIERNTTDIRLTFLRDIAEFYDVDVCELIKK
jgi:DNA-binding XRE family transcriptional regulator